MLEPCQTIQLLGVEVYSIDTTIFLSQDEKNQILKQGQDHLSKLSVLIREFTQLIGRLGSTAILVLPAPLQYRVIQRQQILACTQLQKQFI